MNQIEGTFNDGRFCKHCGTPIADQEHKATEFCPREVLDNGTVKCCKDDYHAALRKVREEQYRKLTALQKQLFNAIEDLAAACGATVTVEQLNRYGVQLDKAVSLSKKEGLWIFFFPHHQLQQQANQTFTVKWIDYVL
jgi:hypothetical protein